MDVMDVVDAALGVPAVHPTRVVVGTVGTEAGSVTTEAETTASARL